MLDAAAPVGAAGLPSTPAPRARPQNRERHVASGATTIASGGGLTDRYAAALYAHADEQHALDAVVAEMEALGPARSTPAPISAACWNRR